MSEKSEWSDELKAQVVADYEAADPTPDNTMEIVKSLAEEYEKTPNGIRMILTRAGVYVKKTVTSAASSSSGSTGTKRVNKQEAIDTLKKTIKNAGKEVDNDICDRLTGKAAVYFTGVLSSE